MKKDTKPLIVAVFLVIGGLLANGLFSQANTQVTETALSERGGAFFISTAQGAESIATLFGERTASAISAVSSDDIPEQRAIFSVASGAIKDPEISVGIGAGKNGS
jgi:hypothetical protein